MLYYIFEFSDFDKNVNIINLLGCMVLVFIYVVYFLVKNKLINLNIFVDVKIGLSGVGKLIKEIVVDRFGNFWLYRVFNYWYLFEIVMVLGFFVGKVGFVVYLLDILCGIYVSVYF